MPHTFCPVCSDALPPRADNRHHPFCSARCKTIDMGKWLTGEYAIPGEDAPPEDLPRRSTAEEEDA